MSRFIDCVSMLKYPQLLTCQVSKTVFLCCNTPRYSHVKIPRLCFCVVIPPGIHVKIPRLTCQDCVLHNNNNHNNFIQEDNIFCTNVSLTYGPQIQRHTYV